MLGSQKPALLQPKHGRSMEQAGHQVAVATAWRYLHTPKSRPTMSPESYRNRRVKAATSRRGLLHQTLQRTVASEILVVVL
eukprot:Skav226456  [mRNA]  locus=scaffold1781:5925:6537:- [translate_table: standard]